MATLWETMLLVTLKGQDLVKKIWFWNLRSGLDPVPKLGPESKLKLFKSQNRNPKNRYCLQGHRVVQWSSLRILHLTLLLLTWEVPGCPCRDTEWCNGPPYMSYSWPLLCSTVLTWEVPECPFKDTVWSNRPPYMSYTWPLLCSSLRFVTGCSPKALIIGPTLDHSFLLKYLRGPRVSLYGHWVVQWSSLQIPRTPPLYLLERSQGVLVGTLGGPMVLLTDPALDHFFTLT